MELQKALPALSRIKQELEIAKLAAVAQAGYILAEAKQHADAHEAEMRAAQVIMKEAEGIKTSATDITPAPKKPPEFILTNFRLRRALRCWRFVVLALAAGWILTYILIHLHR